MKQPYQFDVDFVQLQAIAPPEHSFIITDENLELHYHDAMKPWKSIVIAPGEESKDWSVIDNIIVELLGLNAGRDAIIIGIGGGVVTDIAGFVAAVYKRGVDCVLVPTSILAMVDAAIGGKNGINVRHYKNMIGTIKMPKAVVYNYALLDTLPDEEWANGFAEILKHALIQDAAMWEELCKHDVHFYKKNKEALHTLIQKNVGIKDSIISEDPQEKNIRKILNFGHTLGHAIEKTATIPHGHAVAIGMVFAARLSDEIFGTHNSKSIEQVIQQYELPTDTSIAHEVAYMNMIKDKKRFAQHIDFILLEEIGKAVIKPIPLEDVKQYLAKYL